MNGTIIFFPWARSEAGEEELFFFFCSPPRSPSIRRRLPSKRHRKGTPTCPIFHVLRDGGGAANSGRPTMLAPPVFAYKNKGGLLKKKRKKKETERERLTERKREKKKGKEREGRTQKRERNRGEEKRRKRRLCHPLIPSSTALVWKLRRVR